MQGRGSNSLRSSNADETGADETGTGAISTKLSRPRPRGKGEASNHFRLAYRLFHLFLAYAEIRAWNPVLPHTAAMKAESTTFFAAGVADG
jgi:hypothetical protein